MKPPLVVVWRVTEVCDLGCRYCEYSRHRPRSRQSIDAETALAFGAVLRGHVQATSQPVHVSFLGGEPLLWRPLRDVARTLKHEFGLQTGVTTNGTRLLAPGVAAHLLNDYDQVTVSVDGLEAWHTACRDAPALWSTLRHGLTALSAARARQRAGPLLRVNTVLMRSNIDALEELCLELARWGVDEVTFNTLGGVAGDAFYERERLAPEHITRLRHALPALRQRLLGTGLRVSGSAHYLERLGRQAHGLAWPVDDCQPGTQFLFVDEQGRAGPCAATTAEYGVPVRAIRAAGLAQLPRTLAEQRRRVRHAACGDCLSTAVFGKFLEPAP